MLLKGGISILFISDNGAVCETLGHIARTRGDSVKYLLERDFLTYSDLSHFAVKVKLSNLACTISETLYESSRANIDTIVANCRTGWVATAVAKHIRPVKATIVLHGTDVRTLDNSFKSIMLRKTLLEADKLFYTTPDLKSIAEEIRVTASELMLPVDTEIFNPLGPTEVLSGEPAVFVPTRLDHSKDGERIVSLIEYIIHEYPLSEIHVIEDLRSDPSWMARLKQIQPQSSIHYIPLISSRIKLADYYRGADVVIGQMRLGHGMTELEALSCGTPTVFVDHFLKYGCRSNELSSLIEFFDLVVNDSSFNKQKRSQGLLISKQHDARVIYEEFRNSILET